MDNTTQVLALRRNLENIDDNILISMVPEFAERLYQAGNAQSAAYILSLPKDTPRFTAEKIRDTIVQQAKVDLLSGAENL